MVDVLAVTLFLIGVRPLPPYDQSTPAPCFARFVPCLALSLRFAASLTVFQRQRITSETALSIASACLHAVSSSSRIAFPGFPHVAGADRRGSHAGAC
jgi:hypothetical protein